ncbi:MAG: bifunctional DNA-formamidopyrimidine glycosylase/DNA-(apurinic or apyrimidinic site) lyase [Phycisphaerae bacterium]|nr:bifunctional DNA-formamidopyrimidine glycosylase/DNA-(apurinic or apyrimidinic site) lyase [Phycisphaerae bacterium]
MPELPEVETIVHSLRPRLFGQRIRGLTLHRTDIVHPFGFDLAAALIGHRVTDLFRRGKRIVFQVDDDNHFFIHLGMSGRLTIQSAETSPRKHTHLLLTFGGKRSPIVVHFTDPRRFGGIWWLGTDPPQGTMGPEPLTLRASQLATRLAKTKRPIKNALLDQRLIAGVGNIYADESLFLAGLHPLRLAHTLNADEINRLMHAIKLTLRRAIHHKGSTLRDYVDGDGKRGSFQLRHNVYDRADEPCRKCHTSLSRMVIAGRSSHFCPTCQPRQ